MSRLAPLIVAAMLGTSAIAADYEVVELSDLKVSPEVYAGKTVQVRATLWLLFDNATLFPSPTDRAFSIRAKIDNVAPKERKILLDLCGSNTCDLYLRGVVDTGTGSPILDIKQVFRPKQ